MIAIFATAILAAVWLVQEIRQAQADSYHRCMKVLDGRVAVTTHRAPWLAGGAICALIGLGCVICAGGLL